MKPVSQKYSLSPHSADWDVTKPVGDCFRACIASVIEAPVWRVPHFTEYSMGIWKGGWYAKLWAREWLRESFGIDLALGLDLMGGDGGSIADLPLIANIPPPVAHVVVMSPDGSVYHDPHPTRRESGQRFSVGDVDEWMAIARPYDPAPPEMLKMMKDPTSDWSSLRFELLAL